MTRFPFCLFSALLLVSAPPLAVAEEDAGTTSKMSVAAPYLDMHAGPGRGFPVEQSVIRGDIIEVVERHTDWYLVRTSRGAQGWIHRLALTSKDGQLPPPSRIEVRDSKAVVNLSMGRLDGVDTLEGSAEASLTPGLSLGGAYLVGGDVSTDLSLVSLTLRKYFDPVGGVTPWAGAGVGKLSLEDASRNDSQTLSHVAAGLDIGWKERTRIRLEYRHHIPNSSTEDTQESDEWKAGIAVYY